MSDILRKFLKAILFFGIAFLLLGPQPALMYTVDFLRAQ